MRIFALREPMLVERVCAQVLLAIAPRVSNNNETANKSSKNNNGNGNDTTIDDMAIFCFGVCFFFLLRSAFLIRQMRFLSVFGFQFLQFCVVCARITISAQCGSEGLLFV